MPRAGLTPDRIIAEAATVADETGFDRLTLAAVAQRCGVSLPGLYKHVSGLDEVRRGIAIAAVRDLTGVIATAAAGLSGPAALRASSSAFRAYAHEYPGRYAASVIAPADGDQDHVDAAIAAFQVLAAAFQGYRLDGEALIHAVRLWRAACHGIVALEAAGGFGLPESVDVTFGYLIDALDAEFRNLGSATRP
ncbi:MAG TPA: WHG domain-containing protein [Streptosporangiaceae bacterium]